MLPPPPLTPQLAVLRHRRIDSDKTLAANQPTESVCVCVCVEPAGGCWNARWLGMKDNCKLSDWVLIEWVSGWACESCCSCSVCLFFFGSHRSSFHQRSLFKTPDGRMKRTEGICRDVFIGYTFVFQSWFVLNKQRLSGKSSLLKFLFRSCFHVHIITGSNSPQKQLMFASTAIMSKNLTTAESLSSQVSPDESINAAPNICYSIRCQVDISSSTVRVRPRWKRMSANALRNACL